MAIIGPFCKSAGERKASDLSWFTRLCRKAKKYRYFLASLITNCSLFAAAFFGVRIVQGSFANDEVRSQNTYHAILIILVFTFCLGNVFLFLLAKRMQRLSTKYLEQMLKNAEASRMLLLGEMAGGIAHEVNNPLAIIQLLVDQIKEDLSTSPALSKSIALLDKIINSTTRIHKVVNGLRHFAKMTAGEPFQTVKIGAIVSETLSLCQERIRSQGIHVEINNSQFDKTIFCAQSQISHALLSIINNAAEAIEKLPEKWIKIDVFETNDGKLGVSIMDSGQGIDPDLRDKIMQPFFSTKEVGKGSGLGLSLAKGIIEAHQGKLEIDISKSNTCFVFTCPQTKQNSDLKTF